MWTVLVFAQKLFVFVFRTQSFNNPLFAVFKQHLAAHSSSSKMGIFKKQNPHTQFLHL